MSAWRGVKALIHDAIDATTVLVGEGHASVARNVRRVSDRIEPLSGPVAAVDEVRDLTTEGLLSAIRAVNRAVEGLTDAALDTMLDAADGAVGVTIPMRSDLIGDRRLTGDAALGVLNGFIGDHLARVNPHLDLGLTLRHRDEQLAPGEAPAAATERIVVLVHGLSTTEWSWSLAAHAWWGDPATHFGGLLEQELGFTPLYVRYNTGRPIPDNGVRLSEAIEQVVAAWPVDVKEVVLIGHSMGGLVSRAACAAAARSEHRWLAHLKRVISLGTPHQGAPLARFSDAATIALAAVDLPATRILARVLDVRSAGIRDLSHGEVGDELGDLPPGVSGHFFAGTVTVDPQHPVGRWVGDLLVQEPSASGPAGAKGPFNTAHVGGIKHHELQCHPEVYAAVRAACERNGG